MIASVRPNALRLATHAPQGVPSAARPQLGRPPSFDPTRGDPTRDPTRGDPTRGGPTRYAPTRGGPFRSVKPRVSVAGADPLARAGLRAALEQVGLVADEARPNVGAGELVLWDLGGAVHDPRLSATLAAGAQVVVLIDPRAPSAAELLSAGARGVLVRDADGARLSAALAAVRAGIVVIDPALVAAVASRAPQARELAAQPQPREPQPREPQPREPQPPAVAEPVADELTPREGEVLQHLSAGLANKEIAAKLGISDHTVKFHVNAILGKLGASTRTEAVVRGVRRGLVVL